MGLLYVALMVDPLLIPNPRITSGRGNHLETILVAEQQFCRSHSTGRFSRHWNVLRRLELTYSNFNI